MDIQEPKVDRFSNQKIALEKLWSRRDARVSVYCASITAIAVSIAFIWCKLAEPIVLFLAFFWSLAPPIWFLYEWCTTTKTGKKLEDMKYSQELSRNIWLGIVGLLIFLGEHFKSLHG